MVWHMRCVWVGFFFRYVWKMSCNFFCLVWFLFCFPLLLSIYFIGCVTFIIVSVAYALRNWVEKQWQINLAESELNQCIGKPHTIIFVLMQPNRKHGPSHSNLVLHFVIYTVIEKNIQIANKKNTKTQPD